jgi:hypothetical protein
MRRALSAGCQAVVFERERDRLLRAVQHHDRENVVRIWQELMPAPVFAGVKQLIQKTLGDGWAELAVRIPGLD